MERKMKLNKVLSDRMHNKPLLAIPNSILPFKKEHNKDTYTCGDTGLPTKYFLRPVAFSYFISKSLD